MGKMIENPRHGVVQARVTDEIEGWVYTQANMAGKSMSRWLNDLLERERDGLLHPVRK